MVDALKAYNDVLRLSSHVHFYAQLRLDEDNTNELYQIKMRRAKVLLDQIKERCAFWDLEVTAMSEETIAAFRAVCPMLADYDFFIRKLMRQKPCVCSEKENELLVRLSKVIDSTDVADKDFRKMKFADITDEDENNIEFTYGNFIMHTESNMKSKDRTLRYVNHMGRYSIFQKQKNTLAEGYDAKTRKNVIEARVNRYDSPLADALSSNGADMGTEVYDNLIKAVDKNLPVLHGYLDAKRRTLGLDKFAMHDIYAPVYDPSEECEIPFEEAVSIMKAALAPLGDEYVRLATQGALSERWIDVYENEGKRSGAYSCHCYDSKPFILMNYHGKLDDVIALVHEMGHSMHSLFAQRTQPFIYGRCSTFTIEVASMVNENLLMRYLLSTAKTETEYAYYLEFYLEKFHDRLFRHTMIAEFENLTHEASARGEALTSDFLCELYCGLNAKYYGPVVEQGDYISWEWSRFLGQLGEFYVYKYATGFSAAVVIAESLLSGGADTASEYLRFLSSGDSDDPVELLKMAGVDMSRQEYAEDAMRIFASLANEFAALVCVIK